MFSKINHLAIISENYMTSAKFYEAVFGMSTSSGTRSERAMSVGDGYLGLNVNPRSTGRPARLDHFGVEVEDVERVFDALRRRYPAVNWLQRPSNRPFAGITTHDPDGNVFDLSQKDMTNRAGVYTEATGATHERHVDHFGIRSMHPDALAAFYTEVLELETAPKTADDPSRRSCRRCTNYIADPDTVLLGVRA